MSARALPLNEPGLFSVLSRMRDADRVEFEAVSWLPVDPAETAARLCEMSRFGALILCPDGVPAAASGALERWPGVWEVWMVATDAWLLVWREMLRFIRAILPMLARDHGAHRFQVFAAEGHPSAARFLRACGFRREGVAREFGRDRQDFALWARVAV